MTPRKRIDHGFGHWDQRREVYLRKANVELTTARLRAVTEYLGLNALTEALAPHEDKQKWILTAIA